MSIVAVKITFRQNAVVHLFLGKLRLPAAVFGIRRNPLQAGSSSLTPLSPQSYHLTSAMYKAHGLRKSPETRAPSIPWGVLTKCEALLCACFLGDDLLPSLRAEGATWEPCSYLTVPHLSCTLHREWAGLHSGLLFVQVFLTLEHSNIYKQ